MDGNKDEALRCVSIAEAALASGDKARALKFVKIAQRLDRNLSLDDFVATCENLDSQSTMSTDEIFCNADPKSVEMPRKNVVSSSNVGRDYSEEHIELIRRIKGNRDYYAILGLEKSCSVEEIRRAYRKLSLKVHPDKNKAPGSEEAFKILSKSFKCLSNEESRRHYDQMGPAEEFESNHQHSMRRRRAAHSYYEGDFDPDEIFRSFFFGSQTDIFRTAHVYRTRGMANGQPANDHGGGRFNYMILLQVLPILIVFLFASLPFSEPNYSLQQNYSYQIKKVTEEYGVEFYVKSPNFDQDFPPGSLSRKGIDDRITRDYRNMLTRYCHIELQRRQWARNYPTPHCDKLQSFGVA